MTPNRKTPTTAEILKSIQQTRLAYGADERARYVEHVCGLLLNDRFWPGAADDMITIEDHLAEDARPSWVEFRVPPSGGHHWRILPAKAGTLNFWDASRRPSDSPEGGFTPADSGAPINLRGQVYLPDCQAARGP
jgi:hypothetical protein